VLKTFFLGIVGEYDVWDATDWKGWCAEEHVTMSQNTWYNVTLYSSQDPNLSTMPRLYKNGEWDRVNWLLNNKGNYPTATWNQLQQAFWYILGERVFSGVMLSMSTLAVPRLSDARRKADRKVKPRYLKPRRTTKLPRTAARITTRPITASGSRAIERTISLDSE
jgi:hypothetical protein